MGTKWSKLLPLVAVGGLGFFLLSRRAQGAGIQTEYIPVVGGYQAPSLSPSTGTKKSANAGSDIPESIYNIAFPEMPAFAPPQFDADTAHAARQQELAGGGSTTKKVQYVMGAPQIDTTPLTASQKKAISSAGMTEAPVSAYSQPWVTVASGSTKKAVYTASESLYISKHGGLPSGYTPVYMKR